MRGKLLVGTRGALSGGLTALALPPYGLWFLLFLSFLPLLHALSDPGVDRRGGAIEGIAFGGVFYGLLLYWVPFTLNGMIPQGAFLGILALPLIAGVGGIQGVLLRKLLVDRRIPPTLALPLVWAGTEFLLASAGPLAFPWLPLALGFAIVPEFAGVAEIAGIQGVTLWVGAANGGVAMLWRGKRIGDGPRAFDRPIRRRSLTSGLFLLLALLALPAIFGVWRARTLPMYDLPEILLVQIDIPRDTLLNREARDGFAGLSFDRAIEGWQSGEEDPVLALFPEAPFGVPWNPEMEARFREYAERLDIPVLVGAHVWGGIDGSASPGRSQMDPSVGELRTAEMDPAAERLRNALLLLALGEQTKVVHSKSRLVPGVETGGLEAGPPGGGFEISGLRAGVLICFEAAFPAEGRRLSRDGAELLLNPSNDGWFFPGAGGWGSPALAQHRAHLVLRAIESRISAARSSFGGELLLIDPIGRVVRAIPTGESAMDSVRPQSSTVETGFVRFGNVAGAGSALLLFGILGWRREQIEGAPS